MIGQHLGHYEIVGALGKGGMGEVWRAHDTKLGRAVAIKTLPPEFAKDTDRLARFEREAKLLASLNHPNIAAIYGLEEHEDTRFLVLELVEGHTLADRLKGGAMPVEESLELAFQIAEALEAAHEKGVIHRDLKPANIKLTPEEKIKVLDFGLAKPSGQGQADAGLSNSPTLSIAATQQGVILGTAAYMSPEQARGRGTDKRTDVWAFGCVLYEMLTARPAFSGADVGEILASVIKTPPDLDRLPARLNPRLSFVLGRCLEKDRSKRFRDIGDVRIELEQALEEGLFSESISPAGTSRRAMLGWGGAVVAATVGGIVLGRRTVPIGSPPPLWLTESFRPELLQSLSRRRLAIAPNGETYLVVSGQGLYRRVLARGPGLELIPDTGDPQDPFFSPDGEWVGFSSTVGLWKIALSGGGREPIIENVNVGQRGSSWGPDGIIIFGTPDDGLYGVSEDGGTPERITTLEAGEVGHFWPEWLPGGRAILFTVWTGDIATSRIAVADARTGTRGALRLSGTDPRYVAETGHIVYLRDGTLWAIAFDPSGLTQTGEPARVLTEESGSLEGEFGAGQFAVSNNGTLIYGGDARAIETVAWFDRNGGRPERILGPGDLAGGPTMPRLSPDGTRLALPQGPGGGRNTWIHDLEGNNPPFPLTDTDTNGSIYPVWSPDGQRIVFSSLLGGGDRPHLYIARADGPLPAAEPLLPGRPGAQIATEWTEDDVLIFTDNPDVESLMTLKIGEAEPRELAFDPRYREAYPRLSSDHRLIAYQSNRSGDLHVWVRTYPEMGPPLRVSDSSGREPVWAPEGHELFFIVQSPDGSPRLMAVEILMDPLRLAALPTPVVEGGFVQPSAKSWDMGPDGRFLMIQPPDLAAETDEVTIVLNWSELLKERVPVR